MFHAYNGLLQRRCTVVKSHNFSPVKLGQLFLVLPFPEKGTILVPQLDGTIFFIGVRCKTVPFCNVVQK